MKWLYEAAFVIRAGSISTLKRMGFKEIHRRGSHVKMKHPDGRKIIFPYYDEIDRYTLKGALHDAGIDIVEFLKNI